jgi:AbrB family looped-hinge helix DNA binding protein
MDQFTCKVDNQGRITLPSEWRREHDVIAGSDVIVLVTEDGLDVQTAAQSLQDARRLVAKYRSRRSAVDQLLSERRREAEIERKEATRYGKSVR